MKLLSGKFIYALCAAAMLFSVSCAASTGTHSAEIYHRTIAVEGHNTVCVNAQGSIVPALTFNNSTYVPVRTAGEWIGKNVSWDANTKIITLTGETPEKYYNYFDVWGTLPNETPAFGDNSVQVVLRPDISVSLDGKTQIFKNALGENVYPIMYNGVTYLPVRNIGEMIGMEVKWYVPSIDVTYVFMRAPITAEQYRQTHDYIWNQCENIEKINTFASKLYNAGNSPDYPLWISNVAQYVQDMKNAPAPLAKMAQYMYNNQQKDLSEMQILLEKMRTATNRAERHEFASVFMDRFLDTYGNMADLNYRLEQGENNNFLKVNISY